MPIFAYRAVDRKGKPQEGELTADTPRAARALLRDMGLIPAEIIEGGHAKQSRRSRARALKLEGLSSLCRQMGTLIAAGFPVSRALESLSAAAPDERQRHLVTALDEEVRSGRSLSQSMERSGSFPRTAVEMVRAGESSGTLSEVLLRIAELSEKQMASQRVVRSALMYPAFLMLVGSGVFLFLLVYVVPSVSKVFAESGARLPLLTRLLLGLSSALASPWGVGAAVVIAVSVVSVIRFVNTEKGRRVYERLLLKLPVASDLFIKVAVSRFSRTLSSLLGGGVEILEALEIARHAAGSSLLSDAVAVCRARVAEGEPLSKTLSVAREFPFPIMAIQMFAVGEESGQLDRMSGEIASAWEREAEVRVQGLVSLVEPLMILVMGLVVGTVVMAVLLPIMQVNQIVLQQ